VVQIPYPAIQRAAHEAPKAPGITHTSLVLEHPLLGISKNTATKLEDLCI